MKVVCERFITASIGPVYQVTKSCEDNMFYLKLELDGPAQQLVFTQDEAIRLADNILELARIEIQKLASIKNA